MSIEVKVPQLPESVAEATVITWHKKPGDSVAQDENLVDIETDKVVLEVPAPSDGVLSEVLKNEGDVVTAEEVVARMDEGGAAKAGSEAAAGSDGDGESQDRASAGSDDARSGKQAAAAAGDEDLSPAVRRLVAEHGLDTSRIEGTGRGGRITKEDVVRHMEDGGGGAEKGGDGARSAEPSAPSQAASAPAASRPAPAGQAVEGDRPSERVPMTRLRQRIAQRLVEAQQTAAMLTTFNECDMKPVMDLRSAYKDRFEKAHEVRLGFMSFFVKAAIEALKRFPAVNASIDGTDVLYHGYYDIGVAVSSDRGLMVPIVRDADQLSFADVEKTINDLGSRARQNKIGIDELTGGTFTITNGGIFGSLLSTPILNPPQTAILGMHKIQERPMAVNGQVVVRPMMYLALSYDHRLVDGREAVQFLVTIKEMIEDPARLLLEV